MTRFMIFTLPWALLKSILYLPRFWAKQNIKIAANVAGFLIASTALIVAPRLVLLYNRRFKCET